MLRKRTRSMQKDLQMGHSTMSDSASASPLQFGCPGQSRETNPFSSGPGLFVGLSPKGLADCDSIRSPTSPLDLRKASRSPSSPHNGKLKSWGCSKVGLGIVDSLDDDMEDSSEILRCSESRSILFRAQLRTITPKFQAYNNSFQAPMSLPKNFPILCHNRAKSPVGKGNSDVVFEIGEAPSETDSFGRTRSCSLDSCRSFSRLSHSNDRNCQKSSGNFYPNNMSNQVKSPLRPIGGGLDSNNSLSRKVSLAAMSVGSVNELVESLSASEIEKSEDYTCVISHGPNPQKTHIYGDCILECHPNDLSNFGENDKKEPRAVTGSMFPIPFPSDDFLSFCYYCNKRLEEGKDIYIYRGEKAFCSVDCRSLEIMIDEELEKTTDTYTEASPKLQSSEQLF